MEGTWVEKVVVGMEFVVLDNHIPDVWAEVGWSVQVADTSVEVGL